MMPILSCSYKYMCREVSDRCCSVSVVELWGTTSVRIMER
jgi:hypothetical protein